MTKRVQVPADSRPDSIHRSGIYHQLAELLGAGELPQELKALSLIVEGFENLPVEARSRVYAYLSNRFPGEDNGR